MHSQLTHVLAQERAVQRRRGANGGGKTSPRHGGRSAGAAPGHEYGAAIVRAAPTPTAHPSGDAWQTGTPWPGQPVTR
jgi:hypothetical protein